MKLKVLATTLDDFEFNYSNLKSDILSGKLINLLIKLPYKKCDTRSLLTHRFQKYPFLIQYEEIIEIFNLTQHFNNDIDSYCHNDKRLIDLHFDDKVLDKDYINNLKILIEEIKILIENHNNDKVYEGLEYSLNGSLFKEIINDMNIEFIMIILEIHRMLKLSNINLDNKQLFIHIAKIQDYEILKLCYNVIYLIKCRQYPTSIKEIVYSWILQNQFQTLEEFYYHIVQTDERLAQILELIENIQESIDSYHITDIKLFKSIYQQLLIDKKEGLSEYDYNHTQYSDLYLIDPNVIFENKLENSIKIMIKQ